MADGARISDAEANAAADALVGPELDNHVSRAYADPLLVAAESLRAGQRAAREAERNREYAYAWALLDQRVGEVLRELERGRR